MNLRAYSLVAVVGFLWLACNQLTTIELDEESTTIIEGGTPVDVLLGDLGFDDFLTMEVSESEELENAGVEPGDIREVTLKSFDLSVVPPDGADLSFIDSIEFFVESEGLPRQRIAWQDQFPEGQGLVSMELDGLDLTEYAVADSMSITTEVSGHPPEQDTEVLAAVALSVGVTVQGAWNQVH